MLEEFKEDLENYGKNLLSELDAKIEKLEKKITGIEFKENVFFLKKRLSRVELNKFGFSLDTNDNGENN